MLFSTVRLCFASAVIGMVVLLAAPLAQAAELVVFERQGCVRCLAWEREIAPIYPKTDEGRLAPLRRIEITAPRPAALAGVDGVEYTPTFVLIDGGGEIGRIVGYTGDEFFWPELRELLSRLPSKH